MKEHLFEYGHNGATWGVTMHADSPAEAREKLRAASLGSYKGELHMRIWIAPRIVAWFRHFTGAR